LPSRLRADFQPEELSAVLACYDLGKVQRIDRQLKGSRRSPKVIITSDRGRFLLKRRARGRDHPVKVAYAHSVQRFLADQGFPLARLVPLKAGQDTMAVLADHIYELFEYVPGLPYDTSLEATFDGGRVLGLFHSLLQAYDTDWEPSRRGYHDANAVRSNLNGIPASVGKDDSVVGRESELLSTVGRLFELQMRRTGQRGRLRRLARAGLPSDWHPGNMLILDGRVSSVIDYDSQPSFRPSLTYPTWHSSSRSWWAP
jgi:Ser/Thr protein kinase RdoA (MazF antagonist)